MPTCQDCSRDGLRGYEKTDDGWRCTNADQCAKRVAKAQRAAVSGRCVDCLTEGADPKGTRVLATKDDGSLQPGPRCVTHWRGRKKQVSQVAHDRRMDTEYELTPELYRALYEDQGGKCFVCRKSTGKARRLAVDHDHKLALEHGHDPKKGCKLCIRALLCKRCNTLIGWLDVEALLRAIELLTNPPARKILTTLVGEPTAVLPDNGAELVTDEWMQRITDASSTSTMHGVVEVDDVMDPALIDALDAPVEDPGDFWATEADRHIEVTIGDGVDNFWTYTGDDVGSGS